MEGSTHPIVEAGRELGLDFGIWQTGGGCTALGANLGGGGYNDEVNGWYVMVTDEGASVPEPDAASAVVGVYGPGGLSDGVCFTIYARQRGEGLGAALADHSLLFDTLRAGIKAEESAMAHDPDDADEEA